VDWSGGPSERPPGSLDLIPCDFFFNGLSEKKYIEKDKRKLDKLERKKIRITLPLFLLIS
jgi:hypothetical protein